MLGGLDTDSRTAWISQGFERLIDRVRKAPAATHFDVLIIGSGYGGAIAAATFAGRQYGGEAITVGVLERGKEYLPGSFPTGLGELPGHIRQDHNKEGLFDVRLGGEVTTVVANGVGGGSLINAGVMEVPAPGVFQTGWPSALKGLSTWRSYFDRARDLLGGSINGVPNTIADHVDGVPQKFQSIRAIAPSGSFHPAAITVAMKDSTSSGNVNLNKCVRCGDCSTGCNFGAKNSLDVNLLVHAQQHGAEIFSGATVLNIEKDGSTGWFVNSVHTDAALRKRDGEVLRIRARKVVLAAGTLGSSEILLRSRDLGLQVSDAQLGKRCSTNGDMLIADYATAAPVHTVADETVRPSTRAIGPTITGVIDLRATAGVVIEEMSVPAGLRVAFTEVFATINMLHGMAEADSTPHERGIPTDDIYVAPATRIDHSALYAVMGDDGATGRIEISGDSATADRDGIARLRWNKLQHLPLFDAQVETLANLTKNTGGRVIPNPVWKLLPAELTWLLKDQRGPLTTVHPLGGCTMGDTGAAGVVDQHGRVFSTSMSNAVHDGLVALDGSIIPTALGTNPALTISAVALRAAEALAAQWGYAVGPPPTPHVPLTRPVFRLTDVAAQSPTTEVEIIERLVGPVSFKPSAGQTETRIVELTLRFNPKALAQLTPSNGGNPTLQVATEASDIVHRSRIRIFSRMEWESLEKSWAPARLKEQELDAKAEFSAPLTGTLRVFERQESSWIGRIWRAGMAWLLNRGLRDTYQAFVDGDGGHSRIKSGLAIASRSGEIRAFVYDLTIGTPDNSAKIALSGDKIVGTKTFTYERRCNPWRQLMEVTLATFPGLRGGADKGVLKLDVRYLARIGLPLFRITCQRDGVSALGELVTFLGYVVRLLLGLHVWSFRAPDRDTDPANDVLNLLPPLTLGLPGGGSVAAEIHHIPIPAEAPDGGGVAVPGEVRLTRYPNPGTTKRPVVMFHGYSAGGTTFAHHAVNPNFASHFWMTGRDVWIADLRTSSGHPTTATKAWSFDQIGNKDVPAVLKTVAAESIDGKVDVIAHCMGTVVFSIAVLGKNLVETLVDRAAFTQIGPLVVFSPANIFRAYALRYLINFLPDGYSFNPTNPTLADDLWDRLLSTLPYPVEEFDIENPVWPTKRTPWTRTRHRMDALYGRDFNVLNMEPGVLRFIDEHFGALSLKTVSSTVHFVRQAMMTNFQGHNELVSRKNLAQHWKFPTFSVHGSDTGLSHVSTVDRMRQVLEDAGRVYLQPFINPGAGHQDALVGTTRHATLRKIEQFLDASVTKQTKPNTAKTAYPPWIGPIITEERPKRTALVVRVGSMPSHRAAEAVLMLRITLDGSHIFRPDDPTQNWDPPYITNHMVVYTSEELAKGWDAFEAPLPPLMPGYEPDHPGNALLLLLVYDEAPSLPPVLPAHHYFFAVDDGSQRTVFRLNPEGPADDPPIEAPEFEFDRFERMSDAARRALAPLNARSRDAAKSPLRPLVYRGLEQVRRATLNVASEITDETTTSMSFGYGPAGEAVLERMIEQDRNLLDGVIPYDPPQIPPTEPIPSGTSFALASCQYPAGFFDEPVAYRSYGQVLERLGASTGIKPRFALFVGDQVYVDPTAGLYDPSGGDDRYRLPYEAWLRQQNVRSLLRQIPSFMLLDDHEIDDNWEPVSEPIDDTANANNKKAGFEAFNKYQRGMNGGLETFDFDGFHFFMLDTRTERMHRKVGPGLATAELVSPGAMARFKKWLRESPPPKFVMTPSILLPRHRRAVQRDPCLKSSNLSALSSDSWDGYPNTLRDVLAYIAENNIKQVVFLSGDEHRSCVARAELCDMVGNPITTVHSVHTGAMYAPYPFANAIGEDFVLCETIDIGGRFRCVVNAMLPTAGDGATYLSVRQQGSSWLLNCEFAGGWVRTLTL